MSGRNETLAIRNKPFSVGNETSYVGNKPLNVGNKSLVVGTQEDSWKLDVASTWELLLLTSITDKSDPSYWNNWLFE